MRMYVVHNWDNDWSVGVLCVPACSYEAKGAVSGKIGRFKSSEQLMG